MTEEKQRVFDYIKNTPENTNLAVLTSLLNDIPEGGGMEEFNVEFTKTNSTITCDTSITNIVSAFNAGKFVTGTLVDPDKSDVTIKLICTSSFSGPATVIFSGPSAYYPAYDQVHKYTNYITGYSMGSDHWSMLTTEITTS